MLDVSGLCAGYGAVPVLRGIDFSLEPGQALGILGHNGMGKTTLLRTLIGLLPATAGTVRWWGQDVTQQAPHQRARQGLAYVPQGREIFATLSVRDNLRMGLVKGGDCSDAAVEPLLALFPRLRPLLDRPGGSLSGGEQQLLAIARAVAGRPSLLLLDEPTEGIQPSIVDEIAQTLVTLRQRLGLGLIVVEQHLDFVATVSQRVLVIRRGRVGAEIPRDDLRDLQRMSQHTGVHA